MFSVYFLTYSNLNLHLILNKFLNKPIKMYTYAYPDITSWLYLTDEPSHLNLKPFGPARRITLTK